MERYIIWYVLQLKAWCKRKTCWLQILGMCVIVFVMLSFSLPSTDNLNVGICHAQGVQAEKMVGNLEQGDSIFNFQRYETEDAMQADILSGKLECGFVFAKDFDQRVESGEIEQCIKYLETPFMTKGAVARETVFAVFIQVYGEQILLDSIDTIYGEYNEETARELLEKNQEYLENNLIFQIEQQTVEVQRKEEKQQTKTYPIQGIVGIFLFWIMFMQHGKKFESNQGAIFKALEKKERVIFEYLGYLASVTIAAVAGGFLICSAAGSRGILVEGTDLFLYLAYGGAWICLVGRLFRNKLSFTAWTTTLMLLQMFLCPVFVDLSAYVKVLKYIRCIFPLGIYLMQ